MNQKHLVECPKPIAETDGKPLSIGLGAGMGAPSVQVRVQRMDNGSVRLEQLAYSPSAGWHVQKSFVIPAELLHGVLLDLRKADCLNPRCPERTLAPNQSLRLNLAE